MSTGSTLRTNLLAYAGLTALVGADGGVFDGDNDQTPGGDFYGLFAGGRRDRKSVV